MREEVADEAQESDGVVLAAINCFASADREGVLSLLEGRGAAVLELHGELVHDKASFLAQAAIDLPLVDDLSPHNWDAFADVLWNVLYGLDREEVALVWSAAHVLLHTDLQDFLDAVHITSNIARDVIDASGGFPRSTTLFLVLLGDGAEFRRLGEAR
jgi:hypothetical protein